MANAIDVSLDNEHVTRAVREIRVQVSVVRALLEDLDAVEPRDLLHDQFVEELERLGCRILEISSSLAAR
jgi:hypothetical protein